jgi:hypothetical protein
MGTTNDLMTTSEAATSSSYDHEKLGCAFRAALLHCKTIKSGDI